MIHQEFESSEALQDTIRCFWYNSRDSGPQGSEYQVMPDGYAEIIFHFGGDCHIIQNGTAHPLPSPFLMGLLNNPVTFHTKNRFEIIGIRCFPWTVFDLLGLPAAQDHIYRIEHPIAQLQPTLAPLIQTANINAAIQLIKDYLLNARSHIAADSLLNKAGVAMRKAKGTLPVSEIAAAANATVRTLERNFKQSSGHTVKDVSALMRFTQVRNQLWMHPDTNIAGLAHELGYADQSHLSKEFKRFSGATPAAFARKAKKDQTLRSDFVAFVQS